MTITLGDAPGGQRLTEALTDAARDISFLYVGWPDCEAGEHFDTHVQSVIESALIDAIGAPERRKFCGLCAARCSTGKHELERATPFGIR
jgi:hypothetical protein